MDQQSIYDTYSPGLDRSVHSCHNLALPYSGRPTFLKVSSRCVLRIRPVWCGKERALTRFISHKVISKSFCKSRFPHKCHPAEYFWKIFERGSPIRFSMKITTNLEGGVADQKLTLIPLKCCQKLIIFFFSPPDGPASCPQKSWIEAFGGSPQLLHKKARGWLN